MEELVKAIVSAAGKIELPLDKIEFNQPPDFQFGDVSTNVALIMGQQTKEKPRDLAAKIVKNIKKPDGVERVEVAGPGFINFYLKKDYLLKKTEELNYELEFKKGLAEIGKGKTMVIDYSAPNIAKPFGIGHLRSTNIGQAIYNIYKILGWKCIGDNHLGDWGTQFGKLIVAVKKWGAKDSSATLGMTGATGGMTIANLEELYVKFHTEAEEDEDLEDEAREWFSKLEKDDQEARAMWQKMVDLSMTEFKRVYRMLGVKIDNAFGESFYQDKMEKVLAELRKKRLVTTSRGAEIVEFSEMPPAMVTKSDEATTYFTRDLATVRYRLDKWKPDLIVYEVGADQELHFRQVFAAVKKLGWIKKEKLVHVAHGLIRWKKGKFSTRKGMTIHLSEVIEKAKKKALKMAEATKISKEMSQSEKEEMIRKVAIGAIKFKDLLSDPRRDIVFDWDKMMSLTGDSGPYLQYTYARCLSVLGKTSIKEQKNIDRLPEKLERQEEELLRELYKFEEKIVEAAERFSPSVLAEWLLLIARIYNEFYSKHRIIGEKEEVFRIFLTRAVASVLKMGLELLGIEAVEKM